MKPICKAGVEGNVTKVGINSSFSNLLEMANGMTISSNLSVQKQEFRLQERSSDVKRFNNTLAKSWDSGLAFNLAHVDNRVLNRVISPTGGLQDVVLNTKELTANANYASTILNGVRWNTATQLGATDAVKTFKRDKSLEGQVSAGVGYSLLDDRIDVTLRGFLKQTDETSESNFERFQGLGASQDSVSALVSMDVADSVKVALNYSNYGSERDYTDQVRGSTGVQGEGAENLFVERETIDSEVLGIKLNTYLLNAVMLRVQANHMESVTNYRETPTRFSRAVTDFIHGSISYKLFTGTLINVNIDNRKSLKDLGPQSVRSFNQEDRKADISLNHSFSQSFNVSMNGGAALSQSFYLRYNENPRDRDQLSQFFNARINSSPFRKIATSVSIAVTRTEFINIDGTFSDDNRVKTKYDFRPTLDYKFNDRISVSQEYGLAIEFTEVTFTPDDNFLDRNITFSNGIIALLTDNLSGSFYYALHLHDRGSYLPEILGGERFLTVDRKDRTDRTRIRFKYKVTRHVDVVGQHEYSRKVDTTVATGSERITTDGSIQGGLRGNYSWGAGRKLSFMLQKVNRFSPFGSDKENDYWEMDSELSFAF